MTKHAFTTAEDQRKFMTLSASKTSHAVRDAEACRIQAELDRWMHRWRTDPESILAEHRWTCPHCGRIIEPFVLEGFQGRRPIVGRRESCGCEGEALEWAYQADLEREAQRQVHAATNTKRKENASG